MIYDIIIGIILIIGLITGYKRGLVLKVFDFCKIIISIIFNTKMYRICKINVYKIKY